MALCHVTYGLKFATLLKTASRHFVFKLPNGLSSSNDKVSEASVTKSMKPSPGSQL